MLLRLTDILQKTARQVPLYGNLVPRAFPSKNGWGGLFPPHLFFEGKALGARLCVWYLASRATILVTFVETLVRLHLLQSLFFFRFSESNARARERQSRETRETRAAARVSCHRSRAWPFACLAFCSTDYRKMSSLRGRRLKGKGKGVSGARETRGAREEGDCS